MIQMAEAWRKKLEPYFGKRNLNVGCGRYTENGRAWVNLDMAAQPPDIRWDLHDLPLPFADEEFDAIYASHILEHIEQNRLMDVVYDFARILKVGGHLIAIVPHGTHDSAWENPYHRQLFSERTWSYFDRRLYEVEDNVGTGASQNKNLALWKQEFMSLAADPVVGKGLSDEELDRRMKTERNLIIEMQVVLRKEGM